MGGGGGGVGSTQNKQGVNTPLDLTSSCDWIEGFCGKTTVIQLFSNGSSNLKVP